LFLRDKIRNLRHDLSALSNSVTKVINVEDLIVLFVRDAEGSRVIFKNFNLSHCREISLRATDRGRVAIAILSLGVINLLSIDSDDSLLHPTKLVLLNNIPLLIDSSGDIYDRGTSK
jgi:hypothetical protein